MNMYVCICKPANLEQDVRRRVPFSTVVPVQAGDFAVRTDVYRRTVHTMEPSSDDILFAAAIEVRSPMNVRRKG